jgi:hypothetical protein
MGAFGILVTLGIRSRKAIDVDHNRYQVVDDQEQQDGSAGVARSEP